MPACLAACRRTTPANERSPKERNTIVGVFVGTAENAQVILAGYPFPVDRRRPDVSEKNKETVRRYVEEVWTRRRFELVDELCDADYDNPAASIRGRERLKDYLKAFAERPEYADYRWAIEEMVAEGDTVAIRQSWGRLGSKRPSIVS